MGSHRQRPEAESDPKAVASTFQSRYPAYQYCIVEFLTEHLADLSRTFRGDLQEALVLAVIGQVTLRARVLQTTARAAAGRVLPAAAINASRIADVTGIPRQTVRRKLQALEQRGWIERTPDAEFRIAVRAGVSKAREDLSQLDRRAIERTARLFCALEKVLALPPPEE